MTLFHPRKITVPEWNGEAVKKQAYEMIKKHFPAYYILENTNPTHPFDFMVIRPASYEIRKVQGIMGHEHFENKIFQELITIHIHHPNDTLTADQKKQIENVPATLHLLISDTSTLINRLTPK